MDLVSPLEGWDSFQFMNFNPKMAAEIGRLVVIPECRKSKIGDMSLVTVLSKLIFWRCVEIARSHEKEQMWAIMPEYTVRVAESFGVHCIPIPEMQLNAQEHQALFQKYDRYWLHSKPWFYRFDI